MQGNDLDTPTVDSKAAFVHLPFFTNHAVVHAWGEGRGWEGPSSPVHCCQGTTVMMTESCCVSGSERCRLVLLFSFRNDLYAVHGLFTNVPSSVIASWPNSKKKGGSQTSH